jgi:hypothetical protein
MSGTRPRPYDLDDLLNSGWGGHPCGHDESNARDRFAMEGAGPIWGGFVRGCKAEQSDSVCCKLP